MSTTKEDKSPTVLAVFMIVAGFIGLWAAFMLTLDKITLLKNPDAHLTCSINPLIGCAKNLDSHAGAIFGFSNPIFGLACWVAPIAVGVGILAGARFAKWFWILFNVGVLGAMVLVFYLIAESLYSLYVLCPYCMITWTVTIPLFWSVTLYNLKSGNIPLPDKARRVAATLYGWVPLITLLSYALVALLAQIQVSWIPYAFI